MVFDANCSEELAEQLAAGGCKIAVITGGEPTLHMNVVQCLASALFDRGVVPILYSNLAFVDMKQLLALRDSGIFCIHTSLDSPDPEQHDWFRGSTGVFQRTVATIERALELNFEVWVRTTLTKFNSGKVAEMAGFLARLGVYSFRVRPLVPIGRASRRLAVTALELRGAVEVLLAQRKQLAGHMRIEFLPTCFEFLIERPQEHIQVPCFASKVFISPQGDVQGCNYFTRVIGNIFKEPLAQMWQAYKQEMRQSFTPCPLCKSCSFWAFCHGGCKANNAAYGIPISDPDPLCYLAYRKKVGT